MPRKPKNWIRRLRILRSDEAWEHQQVIEEVGFETYVETDLVMLSAYDLQQQLHPGTLILHGFIHPPTTDKGDTIAYVEASDALHAIEDVEEGSN